MIRTHKEIEHITEEDGNRAVSIASMPYEGCCFGIIFTSYFVPGNGNRIEKIKCGPDEDPKVDQEAHDEIIALIKKREEL